MLVCLLGVELLHADRRTDVKLTAVFRSCFADVPKMYIYVNVIPPGNESRLGGEILRTHPDLPRGLPNLLYNW
jgi:hypothetical protein